MRPTGRGVAAVPVSCSLAARMSAEQGDEYMKKAEKKLEGWGIFSNKYEDALEYFEKAATQYKLAKRWRESAAAWDRCAEMQMKTDNPHEAASSNIEAAVMLKKCDRGGAAERYRKAVDHYLGMNRLSMAAKFHKEVGDLCIEGADECMAKGEDKEAAEMRREALEAYQAAADLYDTEEQTSTSNGLKQKAAELLGEEREYIQAAELFERVGRDALKSNLLKFGAKDHLFKAGIMALCTGDTVRVGNSIDRYCGWDPAFDGTRECDLLRDLKDAFDLEDAPLFATKAKEFNDLSRLDPWKTSMLLRVRQLIDDKEKKAEEEDLL